MNDLSNMPIVTPMNDSQWVPDGSGITPFSLGDGTIVYGHRTASGATSERQLTRQVGFPPPAAFFYHSKRHISTTEGRNFPLSFPFPD